MFSFIKQAYACTLTPGAKIPYCDEVKDQFNTTCPCINRNITIMTPRSFGDYIKDIIYIFKEPINLIILLIILILTFYSTKFIYSKFLSKKLKNKLKIVKIINISILFILFFILFSVGIFVLVSPLYGIDLLYKFKN